ncbi:carboxylesterase [Hymenobacter qilianensis]|uniref:Carboxylesterase n=2 Tax=Hymenobacter qilianensis TaxID=1385715 RepID=A0ACB5PVB8_9BACT|nr:alpha/beta hydrolase [Hymenobacter qilianensis]QNP51417.1 alpha/beta hydrolase [Hymenobacter qilianensis]GGF75395.1 carboxylesterase [Hymenobacter qilianensis]
MDYQPLTYIYRPAEQPGARTLLLLHGTGGDERDLLPIAGQLGSDFNVLSVRGNVLENGMPRFFRRLGMGVFDEDDVRFRTHELVEFLRKIAPQKEFDLQNLVALGYSNGANLIGSVLLLYPELLAGAALLRPMQPLSEVPAAPMANNDDQKAPRNPVPVFFAPGQRDPTVDPAATERYASLLTNRGFALTRYDAPAGHNLTPQDVAQAAAWYQQHFWHSA